MGLLAKLRSMCRREGLSLREISRRTWLARQAAAAPASAIPERLDRPGSSTIFTVSVMLRFPVGLLFSLRRRPNPESRTHSNRPLEKPERFTPLYTDYQMVTRTG